MWLLVASRGDVVVPQFYKSAEGDYQDRFGRLDDLDTWDDALLSELKYRHRKASTVPWCSLTNKGRYALLKGLYKEVIKGEYAISDSSGIRHPLGAQEFRTPVTPTPKLTSAMRRPAGGEEEVLHEEEDDEDDTPLITGFTDRKLASQQSSPKPLIATSSPRGLLNDRSNAQSSVPKPNSRDHQATGTL